MFTGLIEEIGELRRIFRSGQAMVLNIGASRILDDVKLGDSIAVNGVCLTVISFDSSGFSVDVMPETFRQTNLRLLGAGSQVNLERAMTAGGRFGGHIVQGHVDGYGMIVGRHTEDNAVVFAIKPEDPALFKYILPRGSITLDGISLTVVRAGAGDEAFTVSIIPHTLQQTILQHKQPGETVNIECDLLGKYVDHLLRFGSEPQSGARGGGKLSMSFLAEHGFM